MSTDEYIATPYSCPKIEDIYICNSYSQPNDDSCLIRLLSKADHSQCQVHHVSITKPIVMMLEENHILVIPVNTLQIPNCQNGIQTIDEPVVLHLPDECSTTITNQHFTATKSEVPLQMFLLPKIEIPELWNLTINKEKPLQLDESDLPDVKSLKRLTQETVALHFTPPQANLLESTNSWLFIILIIITCLLAGTVLYFQCRKRCPCLMSCCPSRTRKKPIIFRKNPSPGDDETTSAGGVILVSR